MENRSYALWAGLFAVVFLVGIAAAAIWIQGQRVGPVLIYNVVSSESVKGLEPTAAVTLRGVSVGSVESVKFDPADPRLIQIRIAVSPDAPITRGTYAQLSYQGVTGVASVSLLDDGRLPQPLPTSNTHPAAIPMRPSPLEKTSQEAQQAIARANEITMRVNQLFKDQNQQRIEALLTNSNRLVEQLIVMQSQMQPALQDLPRITAQTRQTLTQTQGLIRNLNGLTNDLKTRTVAIDKVASSVQELGTASTRLTKSLNQNTLPQLNDALQSLTRSSHNINELAQELRASPQSLLFGRKDGGPDPGEPGYQPPR